MFTQFRRNFWLPPRAHGDIIEDRTVSFLELFYDLVYVVVIARAAHTLAGNVTWRGAGDFVVIFSLIWIAWMNGTLYYEMHGREDGRTRVFVFVQMLLLVSLAVFIGDAAGESGTPFAVVYASYLAVVTWLWYSVRRQDAEEYMTITGRYLTGMIVSIAVIVGSTALADDMRMIVWGVLVVGWVMFGLLMSRSMGVEFGITVTGSMVERYGLFVIIVLGEVVVGVADGLSEAERTARSFATGLLALMIGFAYWWSYFDFVGGRMPVDAPQIRSRWLYAHLPVTLSIAAAGAAMVSLIEHAEDGATPAATAWLLTGSVALGLTALVTKMVTLRDYERFPTLYRPVAIAMLAAAALAVVIGWLAPAPWLLALMLIATLMAVWVFSIVRWLQLDDPSAAVAGNE